MTKEQKFYNALRDIFVGARVESGVVSKPSVQTMAKIAKSLGVSIEELIK